MNQFYRNLALWLLIGLMMVFVFQLFSSRQLPETEVIFSQFVEDVEEGRVLEVTIQGNNIHGQFADGGTFRTFAPEDPELISILRAKSVSIRAEPPQQNAWYTNLLLSWFPMLILLGIWVFFMRQMQAGGSKALSFGKSKARFLSDQKKKATFQDVAGVQEAKEELQEIIEFLREPQKFQELGGKIPRGVLLVGPPGTGKTLLARAIAGEAGVPFFSISGSDFVEMFVGVGASRVRDLFEQGKKHAPCIIFVDEIDAVGRHRGAGLGGGHDEREQTLNQLLVEMDGFESNEGVILIAATNRPDVLDPALTRPGRFDRLVVVPLPDLRGREEILKVHSRKVRVGESVNLAVIARGTPGFSGADLANLVNEAALFAARMGKKAVGMSDFEHSKDRVMMGAERKSMIVSDEDKQKIAFHESGHTLVSKLIPGTDPIHKVTIIPRGLALGLMQPLPEEKYTHSKTYLLNQLAVYMGGRAAEEVVFGEGEMTTGAANDIEKATDLARKMVCEFGMSDRLGPLAFGKKDEHIFLGREFSRHKDFSERTAIQIDEEITLMVSENYDRARKLLAENRDKLDAIAHALLEKESLDGADVDTIFEKGFLPASKPVAEETPPDAPAPDAQQEKTDVVPRAQVSGPPPPREQPA